MGCCPQPTNRRYNSAGELEVSYDGGLTWDTDSTLDDRFSGTISPPITGADGSAKACAAAASAEEFVKQNLIDSLEEGSTYADLSGVSVALIALLGVTGIGLLIAGFVAAIFVAGVTATQAAFTSEVWVDFRCILNCRIKPDGSFDMTGWQGVKSDILSQFTGVVSAVLYNWVNSVGVVGLTNAARSGFVATADCDDCECTPLCQDAGLWIYGNVVSVTDEGDTLLYELSSTDNSGTQNVQWRSPDAEGCCCIVDWLIHDATGAPGYWTSVCGTHTANFEVNPGGNCVESFSIYQNDALGLPFTVAVRFKCECSSPDGGCVDDCD